MKIPKLKTTVVSYVDHNKILKIPTSIHWIVRLELVVTPSKSKVLDASLIMKGKGGWPFEILYRKNRYVYKFTVK